MKKGCLIVCILVLVSCAGNAVKKKEAKTASSEKKDSFNTDLPVVKEKKQENGLSIYWFKKGNGEQIKVGEVVDIDYKVYLKDGKIIDGNHLLNKKSLPFLVGYRLQTEGWDLALQELSVGDHARIVLPSPLARAEKGIKGHVPSNADNWLDIKVLSKRKPTRVVDGTKVWLLEENTKNKVYFGEGNRIVFHAMTSSATHNVYANTYRNNEPFSFTLGDQGLVPGLRKALINAKKYDRLYVLVPPEEAYGNKGFMDYVAPGGSVFYNVLVMDVVKD